jgi:folate-binding Fe-S cluster repair protein YgfZ
MKQENDWFDYLSAQCEARKWLVWLPKYTVWSKKMIGLISQVYSVKQENDWFNYLSTQSEARKWLVWLAKYTV